MTEPGGAPRPVLPGGGRIGPYVLERELGRGAMGVVYKSGPWALKLLVSGAGGDPTRRRRFAREVRALAALRHPNLVALHDSGEEQGIPWLVMDLIEGATLQARLDLARRLPPRVAAQLALGLARGLAHVHEHGLLHRDVKPENVLLGADGVPRLTDFGLVKELDPARSGSLSASGAFMGTAGFAAPEQVRGEAGIGPPADVYGLGATLYAMLTGRPPLAGESLLELLRATEALAPTPPSELAPGIPPGLEALCLRCLAKPAADRPTLAEVIAGLEQTQRPERVAAPRAGRAPLLLGLWLVLLGVAGAGLVVLARRRGSAPAAETAPATSRASPGEAAFLEAKALYARGERPAAIQAFTRAVELDPRHARAWNHRGVVRDQSGDRVGALEDYDRAIALEPASDYLYNRATLRVQSGDLDGALADAERILRQDTLYAEAHLVRADVFQRRNELDKALQALELSLAIRATPEGYSQRGMVRCLRGDLKGGLEDCRRGVDMLPPEDPRRAQMEALLAPFGGLPQGPAGPGRR